jgi:hypothetical protein
MRALVWPMLVLLAAPAAAELYRCKDAAGGIIFTDDSARCAAGTSEKRELPSRIMSPPPPPAARHPNPQRLELIELLPSAAEVAGHWEVVDDAVAGPESDPDLRNWSVVGRRARHYTRDAASGIQVCSLEVWRFSGVRPARLAGDNFQHPGWEIDRHENVLVMVHAMSPESSQSRRIFTECAALRDRVAARAGGGTGP